MPDAVCEDEGGQLGGSRLPLKVEPQTTGESDLQPCNTVISAQLICWYHLSAYHLITDDRIALISASALRLPAAPVLDPQRRV